MNIPEFLSSEGFATGMKWVIMILITGFIAQFGKKFAEYIIERARKKKTDEKKGAHDRGDRSPKETAASAASENRANKERKLNKEEEKLLKKESKALQKRLKKEKS